MKICTCLQATALRGMLLHGDCSLRAQTGNYFAGTLAGSGNNGITTPDIEFFLARCKLLNEKASRTAGFFVCIGPHCEECPFCQIQKY